MRIIINILLIVLTSVACTNINKTIKIGCIKSDIYQTEDYSAIAEISKSLKQEKIDIIFLDTLTSPVIGELAKLLPEYSFFKSTEAGESVAMYIGVNKKQYTIQTQINLTLNTSNIPLEAGNGSLMALKLRVNRAGLTLFVINTQTTTPHTNESIYNIHKIIKSYTDDLPVVLAGNFNTNTESANLLTGNWSNLVKLDGVFGLAENEGNSNRTQCLFVNGFLSASTGQQEIKRKKYTLSTYTVSFNKNFRDARTQSTPYPLEQPMPNFTDRQMVFNESMLINLSGARRIVYTLDESTPTMDSYIYETPIKLDSTCRIKMRSVNKEGTVSPIICRYFIKSSRADYSVARVKYSPEINSDMHTTYGFLTDRMKGEESRNAPSWLELHPNQKVSVTMNIDSNVELSKIYISFATSNKQEIPDVGIKYAAEGGKSFNKTLTPQLLGGNLSMCGIEGWVVMDVDAKTKQLELNISLGKQYTGSIYIDEIVLM